MLTVLELVRVAMLLVPEIIKVFELEKVPIVFSPDTVAVPVALLIIFLNVLTPEIVNVPELLISVPLDILTFSTLINKEWGQIGISYIKNIMALAFQAFFMMVIVGMYTGLITGFTMVVDGNDLYYMLLEIHGSTIIMVKSLAKTKDISKSIFNAH